MMTRSLVFCLLVAGICDCGTRVTSNSINGTAGGPTTECGQNEMLADSCNYTEKYCRGNPRATTAVADQSSSSCHLCVCKPGYVRDSRGECVSHANCNRCASCPYEEHLECGTACPLICGKPVQEVCTLPCVPGCFCILGYIRDPTTNCCRPIADCPPSCGKDEVYRGGSACPRICGQPVQEVCIAILVFECFCKDGFIRSSKGGPCVPIEDCPPECGPNASYTTCVSNCRAVCNQTEVIRCDRSCWQDGCQCNDGFILSPDGDRCISTEECNGGAPY